MTISVETTSLFDELQDDYKNQKTVKQLGDLLRSEDFRSSDDIHSHISKLVEYVNQSIADYMACLMSSEYSEIGPVTAVLLEYLRVLVNFTADSDRNRDYLTTRSAPEVDILWRTLGEAVSYPTELKHAGEVADRVVVLVSQFFRGTTEHDRYLKFIYSYKFFYLLFHVLVGQYCVERPDFDIMETQLLIEVILELVDANIDNLATDAVCKERTFEYISQFLSFLEILVRRFDDLEKQHDIADIDEVIANLILIIFSLSASEEIYNIGNIRVIERLLKILSILPTKLSSNTMNRRKLFSTSGRLSSLKNYGNIEDLYLCIDYFRRTETEAIDSYALAASSIILGNFITSRETADQIILLIDKRIGMLKFFHLYFHNFTINDVIQLQAVHLLSNIMTPTNANLIFANYDLLFNKYTKIIVDNRNYYQEVLNIYLKFIKLLVRASLSFAKEKNIMDYCSMWQYLFTNVEELVSINEVKLLIVQALIQFQGKDDSVTTVNAVDCIRSVLNTAICPLESTNIPIQYILEKLKTLGILFHTLTSNGASLQYLVEKFFNNDAELFKEKFLTIYGSFLEQLKLQVLDPSLAQNESQFAVLLNNSKFVAGTTVSFLKNRDLKENESLDDIILLVISTCEDIARISA